MVANKDCKSRDWKERTINMIPQHADFERCKWCNERVRPNGGCLWYPTPAGEDVTPAVRQCEHDHPVFGEWDTVVFYRCSFCGYMAKQHSPTNFFSSDVGIRHIDPPGYFTAVIFPVRQSFRTVNSEILRYSATSLTVRSVSFILYPYTLNYIKLLKSTHSDTKQQIYIL